MNSGIGQAGKHHQVDVSPHGLAPFTEFGGKGALFMGQGLIFQILQPLMNLIQGVVDQLGCLFRGHGGVRVKKKELQMV
jgi:hypothetical protein